MPCATMRKLAMRACIKQVASLSDFGDDAPYSLIRPILLRVENPEQLREIERNSPQIVGETDELWINIIKRDVPHGESKIVPPKNPANWYKVYRKILLTNTKGLNHDIEALKAILKADKDEKAKHESRIVDSKTLPKLPRMYGMRVEKTKNTFGKTPDNSVLSFASGSKTKMLTGKGVLNKARREARELSLFSARKALLATPTHKLQEKATKVRAVPQTYVNDHRRAAAAPKDVSKPAIQPAKALTAAPTQSAGQKRSIAYLESDDEDDEDDEDDFDSDPLFSEPAREDRERRPIFMKRPTTRPSAAPASAPPPKPSLLSHFCPPLPKTTTTSTTRTSRPAPISPPPDTRSSSKPSAASLQSERDNKKLSSPARTRKPPSPPSETTLLPTPIPSSKAAGDPPRPSPPKKLLPPSHLGRPRAPVSVFIPQKRRKVAPR